MATSMSKLDSLMIQRTALALRERVGDEPCVVLVSSAADGEGKSLVARALARALAVQTPGRVGLVSLQPEAGAPAGPGWRDLLESGQVPAGTDTDGLWELAAGGGALAASSDVALFRIDAVAQAVQALRAHRALVLVDGPSLAACGALVPQVDQILLVVNSQRTTDRALSKAMQAANVAPERVAGVVLNRQASVPGWLRGT
jgi:Mrp family chromosome partitioning ATPase